MLLYTIFTLLLILSFYDLFNDKNVPTVLILITFVLSLCISSSSFVSGLIVAGAFMTIKFLLDSFSDDEIGEADIPVFGVIGAIFGISLNLCFVLITIFFISILFFVFYKIKYNENKIPLIPSISLSIYLIYFLNPSNVVLLTFNFN